MPTILLQDRKLALTQLSESVIQNKAWYPEALRWVENGLLLVTGNTWDLDNPDTPLWSRMSCDGGATWQDCTSADGKDYTTAAAPFLNQRSDGSVIGWANAWDTEQKYQGRPGQPLTQSILRASSWEALARGEEERIPTSISIPYLIPLIGDDDRTRYTAAIWGKMVEGEHGHLIQGVYPTLAYEHSRRLWQGQSTVAHHCRSCAIYSQDNGKSWHYLATIADPERYPVPAEAEGYCEPDLLSFGNGHLLCVMRTSGNPTGPLMERFCPLVACRSTDGGLTWTPPVPISAQGVAPMLLQMSNGLVVCLSGRPGFFLLFSADEGKTWSTPHFVSESTGQFGRCSSGYGRLIELEPGILGVAYDEYSGEVEDAAMVTKFRQYRVEEISD